MTILSFIGERIKKYGRLKSYLVTVTFISAAAYLFISVWFSVTFADLVKAKAFNDIHNEIVDVLRIGGYIFRALSLCTLFIFFVFDYGKRYSAKFKIALLFLFIDNIFAFVHYVFNSIWNSVQYITRAQVTISITARIIVFIFLLLSLYGLYRQSKNDFASPGKKAVLLFLFVLTLGATIYIDKTRLYTRLDVSSVVWAEIFGFLIYSPYILHIAFGKKHPKRTDEDDL